MLPTLLSLALLVGAPQDETTSPFGTYLQDTSGAVHRLGGAAVARPTALVFLGPECPISRRYAPRLGELAALADELEVEFFGIVSDPSATGASVAAHREEFSLTFPVLVDPVGAVAELVRPTHVPEAFVFAADGSVIYRGRIDDRFAAIGKPRARVSTHDLELALRAAATGDAAPVARTEPVGCVFEPFEVDRPTYAQHVGPILSANCTVCHREGEVAPFPLEGHGDAQRRAKMLAMVSEDRWMPPWQASPDDVPFLHARHLHEREIEALVRWAEAGAPAGDLDAAVPAPPAPASGWRLGEPDLVLRIPAFTVPAAGPDIYRHFVLPTGLDEDVMVTAFDIHPGDPAVVHHAIAYIDDLEPAQRRDAADEGPGYDAFEEDRQEELWESIGGWAPGAQPVPPRPDLGRRLRGGTAIVLEVHYHPDGRARVDETEIALYFADGPVTEIYDAMIGTEQVDIPAGEANYWRKVSMQLPCDFTLLELSPHMHQVGAEFHVTATLPGGEERSLISIDAWDFRWQDTYVLAQPLRLPKGTTLEARARYDNSSANADNPNSPPERVRNGWATTDEMCLFYFSGLVEKPGHRKAMEWAMWGSFLRSADL